MGITDKKAHFVVLIDNVNVLQAKGSRQTKLLYLALAHERGTNV